MFSLLKVHMAWRVELHTGVPLQAEYITKIRPACGREVKLLTQDISLVTCEACLRRLDS